jgi:hypothetical protein
MTQAPCSAGQWGRPRAAALVPTAIGIVSLEFLSTRGYNAGALRLPRRVGEPSCEAGTTSASEYSLAFGGYVRELLQALMRATERERLACVGGWVWAPRSVADVPILALVREPCSPLMQLGVPFEQSSRRLTAIYALGAPHQCREGVDLSACWRYWRLFEGVLGQCSPPLGLPLPWPGHGSRSWTVAARSVSVGRGVSVRVHSAGLAGVRLLT